MLNIPITINPAQANAHNSLSTLLHGFSTDHTVYIPAFLWSVLYHSARVDLLKYLSVHAIYLYQPFQSFSAQ